MSLSQFIRDKTNDGTDIASVLIDVLNGRFDGTKVGHRLSAARLLTIYGHEDADDFIADNTPVTSRTDPDDRVWVIIDPDLTRLIRFKTDDGRAMCLFLIEVMEGKAEGAQVGHRVSAARELLNRGFGRYQSRPLPKPPGSTGQQRSTHKTHQRLATTQAQPEVTVPAASTAVLAEPEQQSDYEIDPRIDVARDIDYWLDIYDSPRYDFMNECEHPDFDPYAATINEEYFQSFTDCQDSECEVHGSPPKSTSTPTTTITDPRRHTPAILNRQNQGNHRNLMNHSSD